MKTYKDVYKFPLKSNSYCGRVTDQNNNFVFQFQIQDDEKESLLLKVINGEETFKNPELKFTHRLGLILDEKLNKIILIRGWGNLTGSGGMKLSEDEAINIQDTFAEYIVEQLNKRV